MPFYSYENLSVSVDADKSAGVYLFYNELMPFPTFLQQVKMIADRPCLVGGDLSVSCMQALADCGVQYIVSNSPAQDAYQGQVYTQEGILSLTDESYRLDMNRIADACRCPTCEQQLTRAYLSHLFEHTPLLCQRFLIQHNCFAWRFTSTLNTDMM